MAKDKLPSIGAGQTQASVREPQRKTVDPPPRDETAGTMPHEGYAPRKVEAWLKGPQRQAFVRAHRMLQDSGARTNDGSLVVSRADVTRWVIDNIDVLLEKLL